MTALLTARQAAQVFGVTPPTIRRWSRTGRLHAIHTPAGRRYNAWQLALMNGAVIRSEPLSTGRSVPRAMPGGGDCHLTYTPSAGGYSVHCDGCPGWGTWIDSGHDDNDLARLEAMHTGRAA